MVSNRFIPSGIAGSKAMEEDAELKMLERKKLEAMRRKMKEVTPARAKSDREIVEGVLYDRGKEVLDAAYSFYPEETQRIVKELAGMIRDGRLEGHVAGGELLSVFRQLGLRFSLKTSIRVQDRGKLVDLSEKLGGKED
jgi:hypothetical protein